MRKKMIRAVITLTLIGIAAAFIGLRVRPQTTLASEEVYQYEPAPIASDGIKYVFIEMEMQEDEYAVPDITEDDYDVIESYSDITTREESFPEQIIFVGDSRTVGMDLAIDDNSVYIAKVGEGYEWFKGEAEGELKEVIRNSSDKSLTVVFNLGVNDLSNANRYAEEVNRLSDNYPNIRFVYASVNPVKEKASVSNDDISAFNRTICTQLSRNIRFIDSYSYLIDSGFESPDGLHYTNDTYAKIYEYITAQL